MPRNLRLNLLDLAMEVDPRQQDGTLFLSTTVCQVDGEKFPMQRLLDIYNQARMAFLTNMVALNKIDGAHINGGTNKVATSTISYVAPVITVTKPADFVAFIALVDTTKAIQIVILPTALYGDVIGARNAHLVQSVALKQVYLFNIGQTLTASDVALATLSGDTYVLYYIGATLWALSDIVTGTATETIEDSYWPTVKEIAIRLANNAGNAEIDALALSLIRGGR
jgi:hypothetical protein